MLRSLKGALRGTLSRTLTSRFHRHARPLGSPCALLVLGDRGHDLLANGHVLHYDCAAGSQNDGPEPGGRFVCVTPRLTAFEPKSLPQSVAWISDTCNRAKVVSVFVCVCACVHTPVSADRNAKLWHGASINCTHLSRGRDAMQGSRRSVANAHAAVVALDGYSFAAPDGIHPSSSPGCRPGLGFRRTTCAGIDETGLEVTLRDDIEDVQLHAFLFAE